MGFLKMALLAAVSIGATAGSAQAQTKYYAREILVPGIGGASTDDGQTTTPTPTPPAPTIYNRSGSGYDQRTLTINCPYGNDGSSATNLKTVQQGLDFCYATKAKYPNASSGYMWCTITQFQGGDYVAALTSATCQATFKGTSGGNTTHYGVVANTAAYAQ